jgi:hypothetical protein
MWAFWLKSARPAAETAIVHFERLAIEAGGDTFTLGFHERLTVIAGVGRLEREGLENELVGALSSGRSGVHLEIRSDAGGRYAIVRPSGAVHRVVDVDQAVDVTDAFTGADGRVNLLERAGLDVATAHREMRVGAADLTTQSRSDEYLRALAHVDPGRLWDVARKVSDRARGLQRAADDAGSRPEDAELYRQIEKRHQEFEVAEAEFEQVRDKLFAAAAAAVILAIPGIVFVGPVIAVPLLLAAMGAGAWSATYLRATSNARRREEEALQAAGAHSYLSFQINRVNGLLASDHQRRTLMQAAEDHRAAMSEWQLLVGDVPVEWATEHKREVEQAHARLRDAVGVTSPMALHLPAADVTAAEVGATITARLARTRTLGAGGESFPTFVDDAFADLPSSVKVELLGTLADAATGQQVIYLTDDEEVAAWARAQRGTDRIGLVEPTSAGTAGEQPAAGGKRSRHVAA